MRDNEDWKSRRELVLALNHTRNELRGALEFLADDTIPPSERETLVRLVLFGLLAVNSPYRDDS